MTRELSTKQLALPGFKATAVGLVPNKSLSANQWNEAGDLLGHIEGRLMWYIGDWLLAGEDKGYLERGKLDDACERFGIAYQTAIDSAVTCRAIEQRLRRPSLSYGHHRQVANRDDAEELLDWAEENEASVQDLRAEKRRRQKEDAATPLPGEKGKYRVLYADPPWEYNSGDQHSRESQETVLSTHYPSMSLDELKSLEIATLSRSNAVLFLWATSPTLDEAVDLASAWGFEYKASFVWDKIKHNVGHYVSVRHELLLICTRGSCTPDSSKLPNSVVRIERGEHSAKPEEFYGIIENMYTTGPYLELFARGKRKGWKSWGNEAQTN